MSNQAQTALAAYLLQQPVKCTLSREESLLIHPKRHPIRIEVWAGCDADGTLTALRARLVGDSGPYASRRHESPGARRRSRLRALRGARTIDVEAIAARTNNPVAERSGASAPNQAQFAMEGVMDRLAAEVGISG